jgi:hypothetical protein
MQIIPATGRRLARQEGLRFTTRMLTNPQTNVGSGRGTSPRSIKQFGGEHFALASYNAGEHRVVRWQRRAPGFDQDEFIDDIPFPETQNYVKRILGTAEDYRRSTAGTPRRTPTSTDPNVTIRLAAGGRPGWRNQRLGRLAFASLPVRSPIREKEAIVIVLAGSR